MTYDATLNGDKSDIFIRILTEQAQIHSSVAELNVFVGCN